MDVRYWAECVRHLFDLYKNGEPVQDWFVTKEALDSGRSR